MKSHLIVTITCPDRPGIVERITQVIVRHAANWEESRFARLGGDFAGIVHISAPPEHTAALAAALRSLSDEQMTVTVKTSQLVPATDVAGQRLCQLRLSGADHEGIVHAVAAYLASQDINVEAMETEVGHAPVTASPLFRMEARICLPEHLALSDLETNLQRIGEELGVDIELQLGGRNE